MQTTHGLLERKETIARALFTPAAELAPNVSLQLLISAHCNAQNLSTALVAFKPGGELSYHIHSFSEAVTVLEGELLFHVEGRCYRLRALDCIHIPAGVAHAVAAKENSCKVHSAFASATPSRELVNKTFKIVDIGLGGVRAGAPEYLSRHSEAEVYALSDGASFRDLFARRFGSAGICGGYAAFQPGASLPCHIHEYDESITIIQGSAICEVAGSRYTLSDCDTAGVPEGRPHRFINNSREVMAMIWVYAGDEPERTVVDAKYCTRIFSLPIQP